MLAVTRCLRVLSLVVFAVLGTSALMYSAPGYFSDAREMDAAHATIARQDLVSLHEQQASLGALLRTQVVSWAHGDLGQSRQFDVPVTSLLHERCARSAKLLGTALLLGWSSALALALPMSLNRSSSANALTAGITAVLLALPVGAMAMVCMVTSCGGPVLVLSFVIAVRDFKLLHRLCQSALEAPHILYAEAQGFGPAQRLKSHVLPALKTQLFGIAVLSFTLALSALVPVEVIFDYPGLGHLAWSAAMNRDLPVLAAVTALMAACIGVASSVTKPADAALETSCA